MFAPFCVTWSSEPVSGPTSRDREIRKERLHREHRQHLTKLQRSGKWVLNGPIRKERDSLGVSIHTAELGHDVVDQSWVNSEALRMLELR